MTAAERIYELVKTLPEEQVDQALAFIEKLGTKSDLQSQPRSRNIVKETLTGLRGIAKQSAIAPTDEEIREESTDYLMDKYQ